MASNKWYTKATVQAAIVTGVFALIALFYSDLLKLYKEKSKNDSSYFALANPIVNPDSGFTIIGQNDETLIDEPLNLEFDGILFPGAAKVVLDGDSIYWHVDISRLNLPDSMMHDGIHSIKVGFKGKELSRPFKLYFHTQPPVVEAQIRELPEKPNARVFEGKVASKLQILSEIMTVEIAFHHDGYPQSISVPVKRVLDSKTRIIYFEFETFIQGIPLLSQDDSRFSEPFFAFRVTDQAGNRYYHEESYAQFMAPGNKKFGVNRIADVAMLHLPSDLSGQSKVAFRLFPNRETITYLRNGDIALELKVRTLARNVKQLEWVELPTHLRPDSPITTIVRDGRELAISFDDRYTDKDAPADFEPKYRVEQIARNGLVYSSLPTTSSNSEIEPQINENKINLNRKHLQEASRDPRIMKEVVVSHNPVIEDCYRAQFRNNPQLKGKVEVRFKISSNGYVTEAAILSSTIESPELQGCILTKILRWKDFGRVDPSFGEVAIRQTYVFGD